MPIDPPRDPGQSRHEPFSDDDLRAVLEKIAKSFDRTRKDLAEQRNALLEAVAIIERRRRKGH